MVEVQARSECVAWLNWASKWRKKGIICGMVGIGKTENCVIFAEKYKEEGDRRRIGKKGWELEVNYVQDRPKLGSSAFPSMYV